jgi:hypothetical protein
LSVILSLLTFLKLLDDDDGDDFGCGLCCLLLVFGPFEFIFPFVGDIFERCFGNLLLLPSVILILLNLTISFVTSDNDDDGNLIVLITL